MSNYSNVYKMPSNRQPLYSNLQISNRLRSRFSSLDFPLSYFSRPKQKTCADNDNSTRIQTKTFPLKASMFPSFVTVLYIAEFITGFMAGLLAYASTQTFAFSRFSQWHYESCSANTVAGLHRIFTCFPFNHPTLKFIR